MNDTVIPFEMKPDSLPDRNGKPLRVGDWIRVDNAWPERPELRRVGSLQPRQKTGPGQAASGELDLLYSSVETRWQDDGSSSRDFITNMNFGGWVSQGASLPNVEKVELTPAQERELELAEVDRTITNLEMVKAGITGKLRELQTRRRLLLDGE
jgi:hypothetical protein